MTLNNAEGGLPATVQTAPGRRTLSKSRQSKQLFTKILLTEALNVPPTDVTKNTAGGVRLMLLFPEAQSRSRDWLTCLLFVRGLGLQNINL